jgi:hypothetical protein
LTEELQTGEAKTNKTKRRRLYHQLAQLTKALNDPENLTIDPEAERLKI